MKGPQNDLHPNGLGHRHRPYCRDLGSVDVGLLVRDVGLVSSLDSDRNEPDPRRRGCGVCGGCSEPGTCESCGDMDPELQRVVTDGNVTIGKDAAAWELLYSPDTPSNTAPGSSHE